MNFITIFRQLAGNFPVFCRFFRRGCWNCILRVQCNISTKNRFISNFFFNFGHRATSFTNSWNKNDGVVITWFSISTKTFGWKFLAKLTNCFFRISSGKLSAGCPKKVSWASKLFSTYPWGLFEEIFFEMFLHLLWTFFQINSGNWAGKIWPACQNCVHRIYKITLKKPILGNKQIFSSFSDIEQEVFGFLSSFSTGMLELHSTCPK